MKYFYSFVTLYLIITALVFFLSTNPTYEQVLYSGGSLIAMMMGGLTLRSYGKGQGTATLVLCILGIGTWFVGDIIWWYQNITNSLSLPSVSDYFYLLGYPLFFLAISNEIRRMHIDWKASNKTHVGIVLLISCLLIGVFSYFSIFLGYDPSYTFMQNVVTLGYGVGDIILIILSLFLLALFNEYRGGKVATSWLFLFLGFVVTLLGDMLYVLYIPTFQKQTSSMETVSNMLYVAGYLLFAVAFYKMRGVILDVQAKLINK